MSVKWDNDEVIQRFREYLRIPSVHPDIDYDDCVKFLKAQAAQLDLPVTVYELVPKKPVVVISWVGLHPEEPSILLNSHMDVVPVHEMTKCPITTVIEGDISIDNKLKKERDNTSEHWTYPPFEATISEDGFIYARGTQDMKSVAMMHLEAVRRLKEAGLRLKRTVHISFVPDEEIGGVDGMQVFAASEEFRKLHVGIELDESAPSPETDLLFVFNGERTSRQIIVTCRGQTGHGSLINLDSDRTAGEKLHYIIDKFMTLRAQEQAKVDKGAWFGDVTTINLTQIQGGVQINVLPEKLSVSFDIRIACDVDHEEFENMIIRWCQEAGKNVTFEYIVKNPQVKITTLNDELAYWTAMKKAVGDMGITLKPVICPGATDARYIRQQGIPAINISPITSTPLRVHSHNESIHVDIYKRGIDITEKVVLAVANV